MTATEYLQHIINNKTTEKSQKQKIHHLLKKKKKLLKTYYATVSFEEPVAFLKRRTGETDTYEGVTKGKFEYTHSDGTERFITLDPNHQFYMQSGDTRFRYYDLHEDYPLALPYAHEPHINTEETVKIVQRTMNVLNDMKARNYRALGDLIKKIMIGIAILIGVILAAEFLGVDVANIINSIGGGTTTITTTETITQNITNGTQQITMFP